jgi:hypothetical protein
VSLRCCTNQPPQEGGRTNVQGWLRLRRLKTPPLPRPELFALCLVRPPGTAGRMRPWMALLPEGRSRATFLCATAPVYLARQRPHCVPGRARGGGGVAWSLARGPAQTVSGRMAASMRTMRTYLARQRPLPGATAPETAARPENPTALPPPLYRANPARQDAGRRARREPARAGASGGVRGGHHPVPLLRPPAPSGHGPSRSHRGSSVAPVPPGRSSAEVGRYRGGADGHGESVTRCAGTQSP